MNHGSIFSGIGGELLAAEWSGWNNVLSCEKDEFKRKWLKHRWPGITSYGDIESTDFTIHKGELDVLSGGDPCQVSSKIGKREGKQGILYLWPQFFRAVRESEPLWVVNENVDGTISNGILDQKIADLESIGYTCWTPLVIPASFAGAWHRRDRVWLVAYSTERRLERRECGTTQGQRKTEIGPITALVENQNGIIRPRSEFLTCDDGIPGWVDEIQGYGNAIVPQVAYEVFKLISSFPPTTG